MKFCNQQKINPCKNILEDKITMFNSSENKLGYSIKQLLYNTSVGVHYNFSIWYTKMAFCIDTLPNKSKMNIWGSINCPSYIQNYAITKSVRKILWCMLKANNGILYLQH